MCIIVIIENRNSKHDIYSKDWYAQLVQWSLSVETRHERQPVLKDHTFLAQGPAFQCN